MAAGVQQEGHLSTMAWGGGGGGCLRLAADCSGHPQRTLPRHRAGACD